MTDKPALATGTLRTMPGGTVQKVVLPMPKPGIVILVHGVNDVGEAYAHQELGMCQGLSERLDRLKTAQMLLKDAYYRIPDKQDREAPDPDAVYYRRHHTRARNPGKDRNTAMPRSVVIPFYWGFREEEGINPKTGKPWIDKKQRHGEYLDRYGNRLDKDSAKNGGPFANATNNLPDMWAAGFKELPVPAGSTATRPLLSAGPRHYMVLAAQRLAMLVRMIRKKQPHDTINVVAHSQGCLITLLANGFLKDSGDRPIDTLVMNHPPYGLGEVFADSVVSGAKLQTSEARLQTLTDIVKFITAAPRSQPAFAALGGPQATFAVGVAGQAWGPQKAIKKLFRKNADPALTSFDERDNRGKVYLYFCPDDQTVAVMTVQGIGWQGVPDYVETITTAGMKRFNAAHAAQAENSQEPFMEKLRALDALGPGFKQRCFTKRQRDNQPLMVGLTPHEYVLEKWHELPWSGTTLDAPYGRMARGEFSRGQTVRITGEALTPPVKPKMGRDWDDISPIDASIAITREQPREVQQVVNFRIQTALDRNEAKNPEWAASMAREYGARTYDVYLRAAEVRAVEERLNRGKDLVDQTRVLSAKEMGPGKTWVKRTETPNEARRRWMDTKNTEDNKRSYHSSIVTEPDHSREVTAYDLAIGQAKAIDDPVYYLYLCFVADWRTDWGRINKTTGRLDLTEAEKKLYGSAVSLRDKESGSARELIDSTLEYRMTGKLPACAKCDYPSLVVTQTVADRQAGRAPRKGGESR